MASRLSKTKKQEYATKVTLAGIFISLFSLFITNRKLWKTKDQNPRVSAMDLIQLSFSTLRLGRMVTYDLIAEPLRYPFARTVPDESGAGETVEPRGKGIRHSIGQLLACPICIGTWISAALVYGLYILPIPTRVLLNIMSTIGAAEFLNSMVEDFTWSGEAARKRAGNPERFS